MFRFTDRREEAPVEEVADKGKKKDKAKEKGEELQSKSSKTYRHPPGLAGTEIVDFQGVNGPLLPQSPLEKVGGFAPQLFQWVLRWEVAV